MEYKFSTEKPLSIDTLVFDSGDRIFRNIFLNLDIQNTEDGWRYIPVYINSTILDTIRGLGDKEKYGRIIDHIIRSEYTDAETTAILSNYLSEPDNEKYVKEFQDFQSYRKLAKEYAKYVTENELI